MEKIIYRIKSEIIAAEKVYGIGSYVTLMILLLPFIIVFFFSTFLLLPSTRLAITSMIIENRLVVGLLTSAFLIAGGIIGLRFVLQIRTKKKGSLMFWFYLAFSIGLLFFGMEKMRWGQPLFISETSFGLSDKHSANSFRVFYALLAESLYKSPNAAGLQTRIEPYWETCDQNQQGAAIIHSAQIWQNYVAIIHSVKIWRNYMEIFPLTFGLAGLLGIWASNKPHFYKICPPNILMPWFVVIATISAIDLSHDFYILMPKLDELINNLEEVTEMLVGISGFLFIWLNTKRFGLGK